jgi:hypothetical protein
MDQVQAKQEEVMAQGSESHFLAVTLLLHLQPQTQVLEAVVVETTTMIGLLIFQAEQVALVL